MIRSTYTGIPECMLRHEYNVCDSSIRCRVQTDFDGDRLLSGWQLKGGKNKTSKNESLNTRVPHRTLLRTFLLEVMYGTCKLEIPSVHHVYRRLKNGRFACKNPKKYETLSVEITAHEI